MWILLEQLLPGIIVGAVITGAVLAAAARFPSVHRWAGAVALGVGYVGGHAMAIGRWPSFPPKEATHWLLYFAVAALIMGLLDVVRPDTRRWRRLSVRAVFSGVFLCVLLQPKWRYAWSLSEGLLWIGGLLAIMLFVSSCFETIAQPSGSRPALPLILAILSAGTSVALMVSGSMLLGQLALIFGTTTVVAWLVACWIPSLSLRGGAGPIVIVVLAGLWLSGYFYAELPPVSALMLAVSPLLALVPSDNTPLLRRWASCLPAGLVIVAVAAAVGIAIHASPPLDQ
ncbi:MAG: hypothetical protein ABI651_00865 [Verrucomicrobiota bacterium]